MPTKNLQANSEYLQNEACDRKFISFIVCGSYTYTDQSRIPWDSPHYRFYPDPTIVLAMMMPSRSLSLLVLLAVPFVSAFDRYAGYAPTTLITDYAAIDLDQEEFNLQLAERRVEMAMNIYEQGGHSGSYALLNITDGTKGVTYPAGTVVKGFAAVNETVTGTLLEAVTFAGSVAQVKVLYDVGEEQLYYVDCQVGGLWTVNRANRDGCKCILCVIVPFFLSKFLKVS